MVVLMLSSYSISVECIFKVRKINVDLCDIWTIISETVHMLWLMFLWKTFTKSYDISVYIITFDLGWPSRCLPHKWLICWPKFARMKPLYIMSHWSFRSRHDMWPWVTLKGQIKVKLCVHCAKYHNHVLLDSGAIRPQCLLFYVMTHYLSLRNFLTSLSTLWLYGVTLISWRMFDVRM